MQLYESNDKKEKMYAFVWDGTMQCIYNNVNKRDWHKFKIADNHQLEIDDKWDMTVFANKNEVIMKVMKNYYFDAPHKLLKKYHLIGNKSPKRSDNVQDKNTKHIPRHYEQSSLF